MVVILFPILFYIPKCFEVRSQYVVNEVKMRIDCQKYLSLSELLENPLLKSFIGQQFTEADLVKIDFLARACTKIINEEMKEQELNFNVTAGESSQVTADGAEPMYRNITTSIKRVLQAEPTSLRRNPYYYQIYYVYLNTIFASLLPLALLLFFNINTAKELFKMSRFVE